MTIKEKIEEIKKHKEFKSQKWHELHNNYQVYVDEYNEKVKELCDFEDKFLKIAVEENYRDAYLYCQDVMLTKNLSGNPIICLRGYGFTWLITNYADETFCRWDQFFEYNINIGDTYNIDDEFSKITYSSKEEFDKVFHTMIEDIKQEHNEYIKDL